MLESIKQKEIILNIIKETDQISNMNEINDENIAFFRDRIRKNIFMLQEDLMETHSKTIIKYIMLPLVAYIDEKIMFKCINKDNDFIWNLLQTEIYDQNDAGEYVFEIIDNLLSDDMYPQICYEVVFLILDGGFVGKYYEKTYDHNYTSYNKKIIKIIQKNSKDNTLNFTDASKEMRSSNKSKKYWPTFFKVLIPIALFGISILVFTH
jgi:type IV/VI secretion system ImpK/VasF family protein